LGLLEDRANLSGKVALVAGGASGLGGAIARDLATAGVDLALCDRDQPALERTVAHVVGAGRQVVQGTLDVRDPEALAAFFDQADELGRLDILVNVVGGTFQSDFADSSPRGWEALTRTNYTWLLHSTSLAIPRMRAGGRGGSIINMTSIEAHRAAPGFAVYAGLKAAVTGFTRSLAVELAHEGIRVNTIAPDMVPTEGMLATTDAEQAAGGWGNDEASLLSNAISVPAGRRGRFEDVGNCALFLASDLSSYVTGTSLHPDGGALASSGWFRWPDLGYRNTVPPQIARTAADRSARAGRPPVDPSR
jgi:3-oxoacyl-[acyl-carrier protein] reductase